MTSGGAGGAGGDGGVRGAFEAAAGLSGGARRAYLDSLAARDPAVCREVVELLAYHDTGGGVLDVGAAGAAAMLTPTAGPGAGAESPMPERVAGYAVIREIGRGGMGVVYEARQDYPARRVALKVVRPGMVGPSLVRRFAHEAETLAMLQHPGIAALYGAGFVDGDHARPYMAMELVEGERLDVYGRSRGYGVREWLTLVSRVCEAVDHAHRRGVVHRDLKPANILVTGDGQPKVLDFGIARLTAMDGPGGEGVTAATVVGQVIGTVGYMSPEQLSGDPGQIDSRCDVYALGVILYEVLSGRRPVDLTGLSMAEASAAVRTRDAAPLGRLDPALRGDVEAVVGKALEREAGARYQSAAELASDLRRCLSDEPVQARPLTAWYQAAKFARRHRAVVGIAGAGLAVLAGATVLLAWQVGVSRRNEARAEREALAAKDALARAKETSAFLDEMISASTPEVEQGRQSTVREMLDVASARLMSREGMHPMAAADAHRSIGAAYGSLGEYARAATHYVEALRGFEAGLGPGAEVTLGVRVSLAIALTYLERYDESEACLVAGLSAASGLDEDHPVKIRLRSAWAFNHGDRPGVDLQESYDLHRAVWERAARVFGAESELAEKEKLNTAVMATRLKRYDESERWLTEIVDRRTRDLGPDHPETLLALSNLLSVYDNRGETARAASMAEDLYGRSSRVLGATHPGTLIRLRNSVFAYARTGELGRALGLTDRLVEGMRERHGEGHRDAIAALGLKANILVALGRGAEAEPIGAEVYRLSERHFGAGSEEVFRAVSLMYDLSQARKDRAAQRAWAERLRGTPVGAEAFRQLEEDERRDREGG
ncbi:MAG: serine/threonine protein kinase [Phycisphaeraceae bacterium]|nr:MAG: serine/threonine protein kinase [Phycisphaeraceae bacterium]